MKHYDPEAAPNRQEWLQRDEQERIQLAYEYHKKHRIKLPNAKAHAAFHAIVENQIAEGLGPAVLAVERLTNEGLSRHDALHAISAVLADHFYEAMNTKDEDFAKTAQARYDAAVERLTVKEWLRKHGTRDA